MSWLLLGLLVNCYCFEYTSLPSVFLLYSPITTTTLIIYTKQFCSASWVSYNGFIIIFKYVFIDFQRRRGRDGEIRTSMREKHHLLAASCRPSMGIKPACALTGHQTGDLLVSGLTPNHKATLTGLDVLQFKSIFTLSTWRQHQFPQVKGSVPQGSPPPLKMLIPSSRSP